MKFKLKTAATTYLDMQKPRLIELGFVFGFEGRHPNVIWGNPEIEFNTLEELMEFLDEFEGIVITKYDEEVPTLTIYDGYIE